MKANELMIGDWVGYLPTWKNEDGSIGRDGDPNDPIPFKVEMVCWDCVDLDDRDGGSFDADDISLYPIPLTREILEKNGFELKEEETGMYGVTIVPHYLCKGVPFEVFCDGEPFAIWFKEPVNIKYVHQLQHAFRLCGIEKEIVL